MYHSTFMYNKKVIYEMHDLILENKLHHIDDLFALKNEYYPLLEKIIYCMEAEDFQDMLVDTSNSLKTFFVSHLCMHTEQEDSSNIYLNFLIYLKPALEELFEECWQRVNSEINIENGMRAIQDEETGEWQWVKV